MLDGRGDAETMNGGNGNDVYFVDDVGDAVIELAGVGIDKVKSSVSFRLGGQNAENLTLTGTAAIDGTGNGLANALTGNGAADTLKGWGGDDTIGGGGGADRIPGGTGADSLTGGAGADGFYFDSALGGTNVDALLDFAAADTIHLARSIFTKAPPPAPSPPRRSSSARRPLTPATESSRQSGGQDLLRFRRLGRGGPASLRHGRAGHCRHRRRLRHLRLIPATSRDETPVEI